MPMNSKVDLTVSPVCSKDGKSYAYVTFACDGKSAEGKIPECTIIRNEGFTPEEVEQLTEYMVANMAELKKTAASINPLGAFMK